ncbi:hypothetical protein V8B55DRAFT_1359901 [Mucor lusitanicus]|uniref:DUF202 domain-containing protein n=2 Tax=Mucor circinelloides f. lusitanicus TaxID=29924 RepID=A0A162ZWI2_MUCCL|nr:hypothetical protein FB192DRAFT_1457084 [Mucor lusitanicus]OAD08237.1 hypothetical protein MUCCIDRAFT_105192 [Mucor lusitanicus CBS 277.49]
MLLSQSELQDIRAYQRTFEGAYWRTALSAFSMGLLILKVFTIEFYHIALAFFSFGVSMLLIAYMRHRQFKHVFDPAIPVKTSSNMVILTFISSLVTFLVLFLLISQLDP